MTLSHLLENIYTLGIPPQYSKYEVRDISADSRSIQEGSIFFALNGFKFCGENFIREAVSKGAKVVIKNKGADGEGGGKNFNLPQDVFLMEVDDADAFLRKILERFYGDPSQKVRTIGITGTNGKTTITYLIESILKQAGRRCGVVGTINYRIENEEWPSHNTTPGVIDNQKFLSQLFTRNIDYGVMEVSSHALDQRRVDLIDFKSAVFTNLTSDHLDYHHDRESYFLAKAKLFTSLSREASAIINGDDEFGPRLASLTRARIFTFGVNGPADFVAKDIQLSSTGSRFKLICPQGEIDIKTPLIGLHNVYNITAAAAACWAEKIDIPDIQKGISLLDAVPGRLERVDGHQDFHVFVDYAHTEDGLKNVLSSLRQIGAGRLIVVFGCGGDRDKTKRPKMGKIASEFSDLAIVTSDNPRGEEPQSIVEEILPGFTKNNHLVILDREEAIRHALKMAHKDDIVLIAGKGHENYQIFKDQVIHFDDREVVREILKLKE